MRTKTIFLISGVGTSEKIKFNYTKKKNKLQMDQRFNNKKGREGIM